MPDLKDPSGRGTIMAPVFFATGQRLETGALDADRRGSLAKWMTSEDNVWAVPNHLVDIPHVRLITPAMERRLARMDKRLYAAGRLGGAAHP